MVIAQTNITGYWFFFDMVTHKIVVIRGRKISVIFYYSGFSGCTLHPVHTIHPVQQYTAFFLGHKDLDLRIRTSATCSWSSSGLGSESRRQWVFVVGNGCS